MKRPGGKKLIEVPGYLFQALVTNLGDAHYPLAVWRGYSKRADCECVIKELDEDFVLPKLILFTPNPQGILAYHPYFS